MQRLFFFCTSLPVELIRYERKSECKCFGSWTQRQNIGQMECVSKKQLHPCPTENGVRGEMFRKLRNDNGGITAPEIGIDIVCDHTGFKIPCIADSVLGVA